MNVSCLRSSATGRLFQQIVQVNNNENIKYLPLKKDRNAEFV